MIGRRIWQDLTRVDAFGRRPSAWRRLRRLWRLRLRSLWRDAWPIAALVLVVVVFVLGWFGFARLHPDEAPVNRLFRTLQLFGGSAPDPYRFWELGVARILAPILLGYAAISGLIALSREQLSLLGFRFLLRNHVVVAGLGNAGFHAVKSLHNADFKVVAIERDPGNAAIQGCRERGIGVLKGDATDPSMLRGAAVRRARHLIITCGDDATNIEAAAAAKGVVGERRTGCLTAHAELGDIDLLRRMRAETLAGPSERSFRLEFFNAFALGARLLLKRFPPFEDAARAPHVLLVGSDGIAESLVMRTAFLWVAKDKRPEDRMTITIAAPRARETRDKLVRHHPEIEHVCDLESHDLDLDWSRPENAPLGRLATAIYVSLARETDALAAGLSLRDSTRTGSTRIVVALMEDHAGIVRALNPDGAARPEIPVFGVVTQTLTPELLVNGTNEVLAREIHEDYLRKRFAEGEKIGDRPALRAWEQLPEVYRESSRSAAADVGRKLARIGCAIAPAPLIDPRGGFDFSVSELDGLAKEEHDRWCAERLAAGYVWGPEQSDDPPLTHPDLVPWDKLTVGAQDKDREQVEQIPRILALAGFKIERIDHREASLDGKGATSPLPPHFTT